MGCECSADKDGGGGAWTHRGFQRLYPQGLWPGQRLRLGQAEVGAAKKETRGLASKPQGKGKGTGAEVAVDSS